MMKMNLLILLILDIIIDKLELLNLMNIARGLILFLWFKLLKNSLMEQKKMENLTLLILLDVKKYQKVELWVKVWKKLLKLMFL
jgi:hypothetical protein